jgi:hypothetical protein
LECIPAFATGRFWGGLENSAHRARLFLTASLVNLPKIARMMSGSDFLFCDMIASRMKMTVKSTGLWSRERPLHSLLFAIFLAASQTQSNPVKPKWSDLSEGLRVSPTTRFWLGRALSKPDFLIEAQTETRKIPL